MLVTLSRGMAPGKTICALSDAAAIPTLAAVQHFRARYEVIDVDGVRVLFGDGWGLIRASNTQPVLVLRFEASSAERLQAIRSTMEGWLREQGLPG